MKRVLIYCLFGALQSIVSVQNCFATSEKQKYHEEVRNIRKSIERADECLEQFHKAENESLEESYKNIVKASKMFNLALKYMCDIIKEERKVCSKNKDILNRLRSRESYLTDVLGYWDDVRISCIKKLEGDKLISKLCSAQMMQDICHVYVLYVMPDDEVINEISKLEKFTSNDHETVATLCGKRFCKIGAQNIDRRNPIYNYTAE